MSGKILVTGADGFIGSHLVETMIRKGYEVRAFIFYNSFNSRGWLGNAPQDVQAQIDFFPGDIRDPFGVRKATEGCDAVLHLASLIAIPYSYHSPATYVSTNIQGTLNVVQAARDCNIRKVIHTSTSEVYGSAQFVPITEDHPLQGQSPYSASKIGADQIALSYYYAFDLPVTIVRPFNTYGPRQSARAVIPTVITQLLAGKEQIELGATHPTRDFNYVSDTVGGFLAALKTEKIGGEVINIGSNFEVSIGETVQLIGNVMGRKVEIVTDVDRLRPEASEVDRLWADNSKAKSVLEWEPQFGGKDGFKRGLQHTVEWFSDKENLKKYKTDIYNI